MKLVTESYLRKYLFYGPRDCLRTPDSGPPHVTGGSVAAEIRASEKRLASLRAYDNNVAALIGLGVLSADVDRAQLTAAGVAELVAQARG